MTRRPLAIIAALAIAVPMLVAARPTTPTCAPARHPGGEWRSYGRDLANTRHQGRERTIGVGNVAGLHPAWVVSSEGLGGSGDITGTPVIADGCLYIGTNRGWVFALNADTGEPIWKAHQPGMINGSVVVAEGKVFAPFDFSSDTFVAAFDQHTGKLVWRSPRLDEQTGSDLFGSPTYFDGIVMIGISGLAETEDESTRFGFQGSFVLLDAATGKLLRKTWVIPPHEWEVEAPEGQEDDDLGYSGGTIWSTAAVDHETKHAYVGTGNPFNPYYEHPRTNALLKVDLDRTRPTFGRIVGSYKGTIDEYVPPTVTKPRCVDIPEGVVRRGGGFIESKACGEFDLDIGASPNLFVDSAGRRLVGVGQKSGVYHAVDRETMEPVWTSLVGVPSEVGGIVGSTAYDGEAIYGPHTLGGYLFRIGRDAGHLDWLAPVADGVHWGQPVASANGVIYTVDYKGFLDAYEARTGRPLLHLPMAIAAHARWDSNPTDPILSWAGLSVARNTVYAAVGVDAEGYGLPQLPNGYVIAYRPPSSLADLATLPGPS